MTQEELLTTVMSATQVLDYIAEKKRVQPMTMIKDLGMSKGSLYRFLETLKACNLVEHDASGHYMLTFKLFEIGNSVLFQDNLIDLARPAMLRLSESSGFSVNLGILYEQQVLLIDKVESFDVVLMDHPLGSLFPLVTSSIGNVLLSGYTPQALMRYCAEFSCDQEAIEQKVQFINEHSYIISEGCFSPDIISCGSPIKKQGKIIAGIGLSAPMHAVHATRMREAIPHVLRTAEELSDNLSKLT